MSQPLGAAEPLYRSQTGDDDARHRQPVSAAHARSIGLINAIYSPEELDEAVDVPAAEIASKSGDILALGKQSFQRQATMAVSDAYAYAGETADANLKHPDAREGIAAFLAKRLPNWLD